MGTKEAGKRIIQSAIYKKVIATQGSKKVVTSVTPKERQHMIKEAAYFRAQHRAFQGDCHPLQDWLEAEVEIDRLLKH